MSSLESEYCYLVSIYGISVASVHLVELGRKGDPPSSKAIRYLRDIFFGSRWCQSCRKGEWLEGPFP